MVLGAAAVTPPEISLVPNFLEYGDWRVRVGGLQVLESLADDTKYEKINFPAQEKIVRRLSDDDERVKVAGLRTLFKLINNGKFKFFFPQHTYIVAQTCFRIESPSPPALADIISSLLKSDSQDSRTSVISIISDCVTKGIPNPPPCYTSPDDRSAEFYPAIDETVPSIKWLAMKGTDEDTYIAMIHTVCSMANIDQFCASSNTFVAAIHEIVPLLLSNKQQPSVRVAALQIISVISKHGKRPTIFKSQVRSKCVLDRFCSIVDKVLPSLVTVAAAKEDPIEECDEIFRIEVLKTLYDLAKYETFRGKMDSGLSEAYALAVKDGTWPARVAFLRLMSMLGAKAKDALKKAVKEIMPYLNTTLSDDENSQIRKAGVEFLSISVVQEVSPSNFNSVVPTLVTLLSDSEEDVRIAALQTLSDLAKQEVFRKAITGRLPDLLDALTRNKPKTQIATLKTCVALAKDGTFHKIVHSAVSSIAACMKVDPDQDVRLAALATFSELSREEAFRLAVSEAVPDIISELKNWQWTIRLQVLQTLSIFAKNNAFSDIINSSLPRVVDSLKDENEDVRVKSLEISLSLIQQDAYRVSIQEALRGSRLSTLVDLTSDPQMSVRIGAIQLFSKLVEHGAFMDPHSVSKVVSNISRLLLDQRDVCIAALELTSLLVTQDVSYAKQLTQEIPKLIQFLRGDDSDSKMRLNVLKTLTAFITQGQSVDAVAAGIFPIFSFSEDNDQQRDAYSVFKDIKEQEFWDAAARAYNAVFSRVSSALEHPNPRARVSGLNALLALVDQVNKEGMTVYDGEIIGPKFHDRPTVLRLLHDEDLDVRVSAIHLAVLFVGLEKKAEKNLNEAIKMAWEKAMTDVRHPNPSAASFEKLTKLAHYVHVIDEKSVPAAIPYILDAIQNKSRTLVIPGLCTLSKLAANENFHESLVEVVRKITGLLTNKKSNMEIRVEVLQTLLTLAEYDKFRPKILAQVSAIISILRDREPNIRVTGLKVLLKIVQEEKVSDRIKSAMPTLLTLIHDMNARKECVALITHLARDRTLRAEILTNILPLVRDNLPDQMISWGHMCLIASLFKHKRLKDEASDLQFVLCLIMSRRVELQEYMARFMTGTLQPYLETWIKAQTFPASFSSAFSSLAVLKD
ncbi:hypothetical protein MVEN_01602300 [Mycena venus]|uniref:TOG domain-containing protein n=1 Tax=Mycena venus TaxID=2733690 RepID=A0A8H6XSJ9_9AGAR|nr:hypothetical protein MVEN_01602300 [Mycena venus]